MWGYLFATFKLSLVSKCILNYKLCIIVYSSVFQSKLSCSFVRVLINEHHGFRLHKSTRTVFLVHLINLFGIVKKRRRTDTIYILT